MMLNKASNKNYLYISIILHAAYLLAAFTHPTNLSEVELNAASSGPKGEAHEWAS